MILDHNRTRPYELKYEIVVFYVNNNMDDTLAKNFPDFVPGSKTAEADRKLVSSNITGIGKSVCILVYNIPLVFD